MDRTLHSFFKWLLIMLVGIYGDETKEVNLETKIGSLIGETDRIQFDGEHKHVTRFLGIPYAKPPIGERRFLKPERLDSTLSEYNATFYRPHCMQTNSTYNYMKIYQQSENCLYLNIYIPGRHIRDTNAFPVMIYIHGGSFVDGGADVYSGDILSAFRNVIVVTINYRLNIFGFLSDGEKLSGNNGLWDMKLAIQWVHDNIQSFGGDPDSITLFGNSAGGAAVTYQAIHPGNKGLFQRVIAQSGSCFASWALQKKPLVNFKWYVASVGCDFIEFSDVLSCLRSKPANFLKLGETKYTTKFVPVVDKDFILESPYELSLRRSEAGRSAMDFFTSLDFLNGVTSCDGAFALAYWSASIGRENMIMGSSYSTELSNGVPSYFFNTKYIPEILSGIFGNVSKALTQMVIHQYTDWSDPDNPDTVRNKLVEFESDVTFFVPGLYASKLHNSMNKYVTLKAVFNSDDNALNTRPTSRHEHNFFYVFNNKPSFASKPHWLTGATHVMELPYVFGFPKSLEWKLIQDYYAIEPFVKTQEDIALSHQMMTFWTNFAKNGNPNSKQRTSTETVPVWPSFDKEKQQYLDITANISTESVKHHLAASRIAFWENVVPVLKNCESNSASVRSVSIVCFILLILDVFI